MDAYKNNLSLKLKTWIKKYLSEIFEFKSKYTSRIDNQSFFNIHQKSINILIITFLSFYYLSIITYLCLPINKNHHQTLSKIEKIMQILSHPKLNNHSIKMITLIRNNYHLKILNQRNFFRSLVYGSIT